MKSVSAQTETTLAYVTTVPVCLWNFVAGQPRYMRERGFRVEAFSSPGEYLDRFAARDGVAVHPIEMPRQIKPWRDLLALVSLWRRFRKLRPQVVHAHHPKGGLFGMIAAWLAGVPVRIYHIHGLPLMTARGFRRRLLTITERLSCLFAQQVLCVSESIRQVALEEGLCPAGKIKVLLGGTCNGIDTDERFHPRRADAAARREVRRQHGIPDNALVLGFVGRVVRDKGLSELCEAWRVLREELPELRLFLVGPFEPQDPLPPEVERVFRSDPRVHLTGDLPDPSLLYAAMDICVLPTYREGFPTFPLEAAAMELPVVATRVPGCVEAVQDEVTGLLVPPRDSQTLADAIRRYACDPLLRQAHGQAARARVVRDFRQEAVWEALHEEYLRLLAEHGVVREAAANPVTNHRRKAA